MSVPENSLKSAKVRRLVRKALEKIIKKLRRSDPPVDPYADPYAYVTAPKKPRPSNRSGAAVAGLEE